ncbi:MAG TPA: 3-methyl-2-oxobutanoate hydroxymethyltransferase [Armatimonadota bacterium]|nr:3-methyl-2-oxobutanoate hydroxymethyltransferase [Armatimonadota bacterium]
MATQRTTAAELASRKAKGERLACLTCYDYPMARLLDQAGIDLILVGDSVGNTVLGYESTLPVTLDEVLHHAKAVVRGTSRAHVCLDLPFMSFQLSPRDALASAGRAVKEAGVQSVKIEGGRRLIGVVSTIVDAGIPVLGHLGYLPQSANVLARRKLEDSAAVRDALLADGTALQEAGCYAVVLELVPPSLAAEVTAALQIPTIGIGSGPHCDGQILVLYDMLGLGAGKGFRHVKQYAALDEIIGGAAGAYVDDVRRGAFPPSEGAGS